MKAALCKGKMFLASNAVTGRDNQLEMLHKIEITDGACIGAGEDTRRHLQEGFPEGTPIGAGQIIQTEEVCRQHENLTSAEANLEYGKLTKFGYLIIAGTVQNFQVWAKSNANANAGHQSGRVWVYIEHTAADEGGRRGYIVLVDAANSAKGSATVENGIGYVIFYDGDYYHGELKDSECHGNGKCTTVNGEVYDGEWKNGKMHGKGTYTYADGDVYDGEWKDCKSRGKGKHTYAEDGDVYDGEWKDDMKHGRGVYTYVSGDVYNGEWKDGSKHGRGICTYADGAVYDGEMKACKIHGKGKYTYADGDVYNGEWKDGNRHGKGKMIYGNDDWDIIRAWHWWQNTLSDGGVKDGMWEDDEFIGASMPSLV